MKKAKYIILIYKCRITNQLSLAIKSTLSVSHIHTPLGHQLFDSSCSDIIIILYKTVCYIIIIAIGPATVYDKV